MKTKIHNVEDLRSELLRLSLKCAEHENELKIEIDNFTAKFRYPMMLVSKLNSWFAGFAGNEDHQDKGKHDWLSNAFRVGLPVVFDRFFFPKSGIIMKALIALVSERAAKTVKKDMFTDLFDKVRDWIKPAEPRPGKSKLAHDYGIPPDSETY